MLYYLSPSPLSLPSLPLGIFRRRKHYGLFIFLNADKSDSRENTEWVEMQFKVKESIEYSNPEKLKLFYAQKKGKILIYL